MSILKLLIEVQQNRDIAEQCNKIIKDSKYINKLKREKREFDIEKLKFKKKENQIEGLREKYKTIADDISDNQRELEEMKFQLYNKSGSDLKLIDVLQKKIDQKQQNIKLLDHDTLPILEEEEKLCSENKELKHNLLKLKNNFYKYKEEGNKEILRAKEELKKVENNINKIESIIPKDILEVFNELCYSKKRGAAELENGICTGCKVNVSSITIDNIKKQERIVYCDNCGRIVYCSDKKI